MVTIFFERASKKKIVSKILLSALLSGSCSSFTDDGVPAAQQQPKPPIEEGLIDVHEEQQQQQVQEEESSGLMTVEEQQQLEDRESLAGLHKDRAQGLGETAKRFCESLRKWGSENKETLQKVGAGVGAICLGLLIGFGISGDFSKILFRDLIVSRLYSNSPDSDDD